MIYVEVRFKFLRNIIVALNMVLHRRLLAQLGARRVVGLNVVVKVGVDVDGVLLVHHGGGGAGDIVDLLLLFLSLLILLLLLHGLGEGQVLVEVPFLVT